MIVLYTHEYTDVFFTDYTTCLDDYDDNIQQEDFERALEMLGYTAYDILKKALNKPKELTDIMDALYTELHNEDIYEHTYEDDDEDLKLLKIIKDLIKEN